MPQKQPSVSDQLPVPHRHTLGTHSGVPALHCLPRFLGQTELQLPPAGTVKNTPNSGSFPSWSHRPLNYLLRTLSLGPPSQASGGLSMAKVPELEPSLPDDSQHHMANMVPPLLPYFFLPFSLPHLFSSPSFSPPPYPPLLLTLTFPSFHSSWGQLAVLPLLQLSQPEAWPSPSPSAPYVYSFTRSYVFYFPNSQSHPAISLPTATHLPKPLLSGHSDRLLMDFIVMILCPMWSNPQITAKGNLLNLPIH